MKGALYNGHGYPISDTPLPPLDGPEGVIRTRPVCRLLGNAKDPMPLTMDLIYVLPLDAGLHSIDPLDLAELVACADRSGWIALHGADEESVSAAATSILTLAGGGRA